MFCLVLLRKSILIKLLSGRLHSLLEHKVESFYIIVGNWVLVHLLLHNFFQLVRGGEASSGRGWVNKCLWIRNLKPGRWFVGGKGASGLVLLWLINVHLELLRGVLVLFGFTFEELGVAPLNGFELSLVHRIFLRNSNHRSFLNFATLRRHFFVIFPPQPFRKGRRAPGSWKSVRVQNSFIIPVGLVPVAVHVRIVVCHCIRMLDLEQLEILFSARVGQLSLHRDLLLVCLGVVENKLFLRLPLLQLLVAADVFASSVLELPQEFWLSGRVFRWLLLHFFLW